MAGSPADSAHEAEERGGETRRDRRTDLDAERRGAVRVGARVVETAPARGDEAARADQQGTVEVVAHQLRGRQPLLDVAQRRGQVARAALQLGQRVQDQGPGPVLAQLGEPAVLGEQHRACGDDLVGPAQHDSGHDVRSRLLRGVAAPRGGRACGVEQVHAHAAAHPELRPRQRGLALRDRGPVAGGPRGDEGGGGVPVGGRHGADEDQGLREESLRGRPQRLARACARAARASSAASAIPFWALRTQASHSSASARSSPGGSSATSSLSAARAASMSSARYRYSPIVDPPSDQRVAGSRAG